MNTATATAPRYTFTAEQKSAFRAAITSHYKWTGYRQRTGSQSSDLTIGTMLAIAGEFGINPADYGTAKGILAMAFNHQETGYLRERFNAVAHKLSNKQCKLCLDIFATSDTKQNGAMTSRQYTTIASICRDAENGTRSYVPRNRGGHTGSEDREYEDAMRYESDKERAANASNEETAKVKETPNASATVTGAANVANELAVLIGKLATQSVTPESVAALVDERIQAALKNGPAVRIELRDTSGDVRTHSGIAHRTFATLARMAVARGLDGFPLNIWLSGPAGSGKTRAGQDLAKLLGLPFYGMGAKQTSFDVLGYCDGAGTYHKTPFRDAFEHGGVFQADEIDAWDNEAVQALNSATANDFCQFPDAIVARHTDFRCIAGANTWGHGSTSEYCGRTKIDGASLTRFAKLAWEYDPALESALSGNITWAIRVQRARAKAADAGLKVLITPRATLQGAALIAAGFTEDEAAQFTYLADLSADQRAIVGV
jgi:cobaltochelatase CobS